MHNRLSSTASTQACTAFFKPSGLFQTPPNGLVDLTKDVLEEMFLLLKHQSAARGRSSAS